MLFVHFARFLLPIPTLIIHHIQITPDHRRPRSFRLDLFLGKLDLAAFRRLVPFGDPDGDCLAFEGGRVDVDQGDDPGVRETREKDDSGGCRGVCVGVGGRVRRCDRTVGRAFRLTADKRGTELGLIA